MRHLRWVLVPIIVVPLVALLGHGFTRDPADISSPLIGKPVPSFQLVALDGQTVRADQLRGRPVLINFWASWCAPCVAEHAVLRAAQARYGARLRIVGVLYQDTADDARRFLARYGGGWKTLLDPDGTLALSFGVTGPPESYLVDASGVVRDKQFGPLTEEIVEAMIPPLLVAGAPPPTGSNR